MGYIVNREFLENQCKRLTEIHRKESEELDLNNWYIVHNKGHEIIINDFVVLLKSKNRKYLLKWLKKERIKANKILDDFDKKYGYTEMEKDDQYIYKINDGKFCIANMLGKIVRKEKYISK